MKVSIEQVASSREYKVFADGKYVGNIENKPNYHNKYIDTLLFADADNLLVESNLMPKNSNVVIKFIGEINHTKN